MLNTDNRNNFLLNKYGMQEPRVIRWTAWNGTM